MGQKKLIRFQAIHSFPNVLQYPKDMAGKWKDFFKNENPLTLELACGKGEYTVGLSRLHPERNFVGVDLKGNRIYVGALDCLKNDIKNAAFLRTHIDKIDTYFSAGEVDELWITFPDPHLRTSRAKKRLTHPHFLRLYQRILKPGGFIHLKTDSPNLFYFTKLMAGLYSLEISDESDDVHARLENPVEILIKTHYENLDIAASKQVYYLRFTIPEQLIPPPDIKLQELLKQLEKTEIR